MKVLVTGGSGFIGSALVRYLLEADYEVRVLARHKRNRLLEGLDVEIAEGDIVYPHTVERAVRGCGIVFNFASIYAFYPFWNKTPKSIYKVNVAGTVNVLTAALKHKVERFIHTSTIATIGRDPDGRASNEDSPFDLKNASHYARSKYLAEQEVLKFFRMGLEAVILNPAIAIGERDYKPTPSGETIVNFLNRRYPAYFNASWSVADVDDIARAHIAAIKHGKPGQRYILCNRRHYTLKEIFSLLEEVSGVKSPRIYVPYPLLSAFVHIDEFVSSRLLKKKPLMPVEGVRFCRECAVYDNSRAVKVLGFRPTAIRETFSKAVRWYRENGYVEPVGIMRFKAHAAKPVKALMCRIGINKYADRLDTDTLIFYLAVKFLHFLRKIGFRPKEDGWRRVTQSYLRTEHAKFVLAAFHLDIYSNAKAPESATYASTRKHIIERLAGFFRDHPACCWQLEWRLFSTVPVENKYVDITCADFDKNGKLIHIEPYLEQGRQAQVDPGSIRLLSKVIIECYNKTLLIKDSRRPLVLRRLIRRKIRRGLFFAADRILSSTFISFERMPPQPSAAAQRFRSPAFIRLKALGFGFMNILCRLSHDLKESDLWFQFHHVPCDGVPMQEILNSLKRKWGTRLPLTFPCSRHGEKARAELCSTLAGRSGTYQIRDFIDFRPFLVQRRLLNAKFSVLNKGTVTTAALFIWKLAHYPYFEDVKFAVPVDLPATVRRPRTLGLIFIRPSIYFDRNKFDAGFMKFQQEFNRQLRQTRKRQSSGYRLLESYCLLPPPAYSATIKLMRHALNEFVGTVGITIIKKSDLFLAPYSDVHTGGFIAISNYFIPSDDGGKLCNISIKGPKDRIEGYLETIKQVTAQT